MLTHLNTRDSFRILSLSMLFFILAGCSGPPKVSLDDPDEEQKNVGLVYGYINMEATRSSAYDWIVARQYRPATKDYELHVYRSGLFYHIGVEPGSHQIVRLGTETKVRRFDHYRKNQTAVKVKKPGLYYMGSYDYLEPKEYEFDLRKARSPSEKEVLKMLLEVMEDDHDEYITQIRWIKNRIKQL